MKTGLICLAQHRAAELLARARDEAAALHTTAREAGYQEGIEAGRQLAARQAESWKQRADDLLADYQKSIDAHVQAELDKLEPHLLELVMTVVRQVVKQEIEQNRNVIRGQVDVAVEALGKSMLKSIRVNPSDLNHLIDAGVAGLPLVGDARIQPGGCLAEGDGMVVDASIETQLSRLEEELKRRD